MPEGESSTIVMEGLNGKNVGFSLYDENGNLLGISSPGATNYTTGLNNFVAPAAGTSASCSAGDTDYLGRHRHDLPRQAGYHARQHSGDGQPEALLRLDLERPDTGKRQP